MNLNCVLIIAKHNWDKAEHDSHRREHFEKTLQEITDTLHENNIEYKVIKVDDCASCDITKMNPDLIIALGGDGTLLSIHQLCVDIPVLPIRGDTNSKGALMNISSGRKLIELLLNDDLALEKWSRVEHKESGLLGLNELYIGPLYASGTGRFCEGNLSVVASGMLAVTGAGSTGWYASLGYLPFDMQKNLIKIVYREPVELAKEHELKKDEEFTIQVCIRENGVIIADGANPNYVNKKHIVLNYGQTITLGQGPYLNVYREKK